MKLRLTLFTIIFVSFFLLSTAKVSAQVNNSTTIDDGVYDMNYTCPGGYTKGNNFCCVDAENVCTSDSQVQDYYSINKSLQCNGDLRVKFANDNSCDYTSKATNKVFNKPSIRASAKDVQCPANYCNINTTLGISGQGDFQRKICVAPGKVLKELVNSYNTDYTVKGPAGSYMCCPAGKTGTDWQLEDKFTQNSPVCTFDTNQDFFKGSTLVPYVEKTPEQICSKDALSSDTLNGSKYTDIHNKCCNCLTGNDGCSLGNPNPNADNLWTGLGCISTTSTGLTVSLMRIFYGIGIFVLLLRLIQAGYLYQLGDPEKIKDARDIIFSVILGMIVFTGGILILNFLGVDVLGLGQFLTALPTLK